MRRTILLIAGAILALSTQGQPLQWLTDKQAALNKAKQENKAVLLDFTGSDWCGWCIKLKKQVFDQPEFAEFARANLVLVEVDFPRHKVMSRLQMEANHDLAEAFHVTGYPTIVVLDQNGKLIGRSGYRPYARSFIAEIESMLQEGNHKPTPPASKPETAPETRVRKPVTFTPLPPAAKNHYDKLALKGLSGPKDRRMALINNEVFFVGDTAMVSVQDERLAVCCKEIRDDSVLITVDDKPMELKLRNP
jgi:protein disulfide-isomerase